MLVPPMSKLTASAKPHAAAIVGRGAHAARRARQQQRRRRAARRRSTGTSPPADVITSASGANAASWRRYGAHTGSRNASTTVVTMRSYSRNSGLTSCEHTTSSRPRRAQRAGDGALVRGVEIGVQQAHRDRVDVVGDARAAAPSKGSISSPRASSRPDTSKRSVAGHERLRAGRRTGRTATAGPGVRSRSRRRSPASRSARRARPRRSSSAFVATVVPCASTSTRPPAVDRVDRRARPRAPDRRASTRPWRPGRRRRRRR